MSKKLLMVLIAIALTVGISVISTPAFAGMPLPNGTKLSVDLGNGNGAECTTGSCFSMEVQPGFLTWTDIGPGTPVPPEDGGFILGKNQLCGGPANSGSDNTSGQLTAAWFFFGNFGSNCTGTFTAGGGTSVTTGADQNIFDARSCSSAINCLSLTKLGSWHVAWNAIAIPMGSALGCKATDPTGCTGVTEWTLTPNPVVTGSTYVLKHAWVVPAGDPSGFGDVHYAVILRGTVTLPAPCADMSTRCDDGNGCTTDTCNPVTGVCSHGGAPNCDDGNACTIDSCDSILGCLHVNVNNGTQCNDNNACTLNDVCSISSQDGISHCAGTPKTCAAPDACTDSSCNTSTGACGTTSLCQSPATCDPPTGVCLGPSGVNSSNNNFTMLDPNGSIIGGTNDVKFTYTKIPLTSVAVSGQASNATITSSCPFFGNTWTAHDVAIYGPGTYTVYAGCPPGSPGCGTGTPITFTVGVGELGGHMLFNWSSNKDIDVVDIWAPHAAFGPDAMFTQNQGCGTNDPKKVWDLMSKDWDNNGVNGKGMVDGPFINFNANFNLMMTSNIAPPTRPVLVFPADGATGLPTTVEFRWKRSIDYDNDPITYNFEICTDSTFTGCAFVPVSAVASRNSKGMFYAGGAGLFMIGMTFLGGLKGQRRLVLLFMIVVLLSGGALISCNNSNSSNLQGKALDIGEMSHTVSGLSTKTTYFWRVSASDGKAAPNVSKPTFSFTTQ